MKFEVTKDNEPFIDARGKVILNACPGSGKTTSIAYKLQALFNECYNKYGRFSGIACLSFTNVAKDEINEKYHSFSGHRISYPNIVSTIDSFINSYITLPFYYLLEYDSKRPTILEDSNFLNDLNIGFFKSNNGQPLKYIYPPSNITLEVDETYTINGHKPNPEKVNINTFNRYCDTYKNWQFKNGFLKNEDSVIAAIRLIDKYPKIAQYLTKRFPYIIVDEAQDTSEAQFYILDSLISAGVENIELIGDPYQSLYEFREARPDLFINRFKDEKNWQPLRLSDCRRSSQKIIDAYCILRNTSEGKISSNVKIQENNPINILIYNPNEFQEIVESFSKVVDMEEDNRILVRGSTYLEKFGVKINKEKPWKSDLPYLILEAQRFLSIQNIKKCVDTTRKFLIELLYNKSTPDEKKIKEKELKGDMSTNSLLLNFIKELPDTELNLKEWTEKTTEYINATFEIENTDLQLKQKKGEAYYNQKLNDIFMTEIDTKIPISTIHKVKGMSFDSILLVLSENSSGQNLSIKDIFQPKAIPSDKQRLIYVAMSRPRKLLCLAIPNNYSKDEIQKIFGDDIVYI